METSEDFIKRLKNDIFDTLVYVEDSMREANEIKDKAYKVVEQLNRLPIKDDKDMEKKTNKMTKAEAFEWLKFKKIDTNGYADLVQKKLFDLGVVWCTGDTGIVVATFLFIDANGELTHCGNDANYWLSHYYEAIRADEVLSLEIEEECAKDDEDPYFGGRIKDLQQMIGDDEVLIITKTNFLTMTK